MKTFHWMMCLTFTTGVFVSSAATQTQVATARIGVTKSSPTGFVIDGTTVPVAGIGVDLKQLVRDQARLGHAYALKLRPGTSRAGALEILDGTPVPAGLEMSELVFGQTAKIAVFAPLGSHVWIQLDHVSGTGFLPLGPTGAWFLGPSAIELPMLKIDNVSHAGVAYFRVPALPELVGEAFVAQALVAEPTDLWTSNPSGRTVR